MLSDTAAAAAAVLVCPRCIACMYASFRWYKKKSLLLHSSLGALRPIGPIDIAVRVRSLSLALLNRRKDVLRSVNILVYNIFRGAYKSPRVS